MSNLPVIRKEFMSDAVVAEIQDAIPNAMGKHAKEIAIQFVKTAYAAISQNPTLQQCTTKSLIRSMQQSASVNLPIDKRQLAFFVPYKNHGVMEAQLQISYLGLMELAYRSEKVKSITANCIYESEKDSVKIKRIDGRFYVEHPFSFEQPKGDIIAVYATAEVEGIPPQTIVLRKEEVERFRSKSKAPDSPAWTEFYDAMAKKTAIRQLAKFLPKSVAKEFSLGAMIDEYEDFVTAQTNAARRIEAEQGSELVDATFEANGGEQEERDAETQAKIDAQKKALTEAESKDKKAKRGKSKKSEAKTTARPKNEPDPYICLNCKRTWKGDELKKTPRDELQCPKCFSTSIDSTQHEQQDFMED
jgi:recombination protein RecT